MTEEEKVVLKAETMELKSVVLKAVSMVALMAVLWVESTADK